MSKKRTLKQMYPIVYRQRMFNMKETAEFLRIDPKTLRRMVRFKYISCYRFRSPPVEQNEAPEESDEEDGSGGRFIIRFSRRDLIEFRKKHRIKAK